MLLVFVAVVLIVIASVGWGAWLAGRLWGDDASGHLNLGEAGLLGLFWITAVGTAINFAVPLSSWLTTGMTVVGVALGVRHFAIVRRALHHLTRLDVVACLFFLFFFSYLAYIREYHADTEAYHLPWITWLHESRTPVGIVHMGNALGFNSLWFVTAAWFWVPGLSLASVFSINAVIMTLFFIAMYQAVVTAWRWNEPRLSSWYALAVLGFLFTGGISFIKIIGSPNTDIPAALLTIYCFYLALRLSDEEFMSARYMREWGLLVALSLFAVFIKLSQLPILILPLVYGVRIYRVASHLWFDRGVLAIITVSGVLSVFWLIRGLFTSGCLFYPLPQSCLTWVPWVATLDLAIPQQNAIRAYGLYGQSGINPGFDDWTWFSSWWQRFTEHHFVRGMMFMLMLGLLVVVLSWARHYWLTSRRVVVDDDLRHSNRKQVPVNLQPAGWLAGLSLVAIVYWFLSAPDIRFGYGYLTAFVALMLVIFIAASGTWARKVFVRMILVLITISVLLNAVKFVRDIGTDDWFTPWPTLSPKPVPMPGCPALLGIWPRYHCPSDLT